MLFYGSSVPLCIDEFRDERITDQLLQHAAARPAAAWLSQRAKIKIKRKGERQNE